MADSRRLGLGTVQFGLPYGVTNATGKVGVEEAGKIVDFAEQSRLAAIDTAAAYGDSEAVLGQCLPPRGDVPIVSKTLPIRKPRIGADDLDAVSRRFHASLKNLGRPCLDGLLVHHADDLLVPGGDALHALLCEWKAKGLVRRIGVSVYDRQQIDALVERFGFPDLVQLPLSVFDQRLVADGTIDLLHGAGVEIHARSVFLQGLLLVDSESLPQYFAPIRDRHAAYLGHLGAHGVSPLAAALGFLRSLPQVAVALVGVLSLAHLQECVAAYDAACSLDLAEFAIADHRFVDPRGWPAP